MLKRAPPRPRPPGDQDTPATPHRQAAAEAAAAHRTALAMSRWRSGDTAADLRTAAALHPGPQAQWQAALQRQFCAWLDAGGFAAPEPAQEQKQATAQPAPPMKTAALRRCSQPHCGTIDEELKFSLLRIRDAVE
ncbi:hypothetical protein H3H37_14310 [Duganella sp. LX20W]|uniref:Uncharacterized protein n=1 Tax=Rugamonas brunnea TaxID=2758569 RepID=A0A7W2ETA5_9BURK|nr:hypothetical protein [Rugamonas brunnea]MBA5638228.1 hypothetical protein [Rugamonas brunnea]